MKSTILSVFVIFFTCIFNYGWSQENKSNQNTSTENTSNTEQHNSKRIQHLKMNQKASQVSEGQNPKQISKKASSNSNSNNAANYPVSYAVGRDGVQKVVKKGVSPQVFNNETTAAVKTQLKEIFGQYYEVYGAPNMDFYAEFYERCEFLSLNNGPSGLENLSSLEIKDKYNSEKIFHDNLEVFNADQFNVLKYHIDYFNQQDEYYKIYNTDMLLKIKGLN